MTGRLSGVAHSVDGVNRTDRLYAMVEELRAVAPRPRSAAWLAGRFEVSRRTVERDVSALQQSGVPVYAEPGRRGGYVLDRAASLPPLNFTPYEATAIAVALARATGTPFADATRTALHKVLAAMPAEQAASTRTLAESVRFIRGPDDETPDVPLVLQHAMATRRVLLIDYADRHGAVTRRAVEPVAFLAGTQHWYLLGWCRLRDAARGFRLDRVRAASATEERVPRRSVDDVAAGIPAELLRRVEV